MNKFILFIMTLFLSTSLYSIERLQSIAQLQEHKLIFLVFERTGCPWCSKYKTELEFTLEEEYKEDIKFFKVKKGSEVFSMLTNVFRQDVIIYPMTYIIKLDENKESKIIYEIYGYQTEDYVEDLFDKEIIKK